MFVTGVQVQQGLRALDASKRTKDLSILRLRGLRAGSKLLMKELQMPGLDQSSAVPGEIVVARRYKRAARP